MCLGPPCVELALEFVNLVKALPIVLERWWLGDEDGLRGDLTDTRVVGVVVRCCR